VAEQNLHQNVQKRKWNLMVKCTKEKVESNGTMFSPRIITVMKIL